MAVIVHPNVDLDSCLCVALLGDSDIHFLPADAKKTPSVCPCCNLPLKNPKIIDHPLGEKGKLDKNGRRHSAAASLKIKCDPDLLAEVEEQETTGKIEQARFNLARILAAIRTEAYDRGLRDKNLDCEVLNIMGRILRGLNLLYKFELEQEKLVSGIKLAKISDFIVAILPEGEVPPILGIILNEKWNVSCAIYKTGYTLGITRYPGRDRPNLTKLKPHLKGWFIHPAGFLACWGSRKAPAINPPPKDTPQNEEELFNLIKQIFSKKEDK